MVGNAISFEEFQIAQTHNRNVICTCRFSLPHGLTAHTHTHTPPIFVQTYSRSLGAAVQNGGVAPYNVCLPEPII